MTSLTCALRNALLLSMNICDRQTLHTTICRIDVQLNTMIDRCDIQLYLIECMHNKCSICHHLIVSICVSSLLVWISINTFKTTRCQRDDFPCPGYLIISIMKLLHSDLVFSMFLCVYADSHVKDHVFDGQGILCNFRIKSTTSVGSFSYQ